MLPCREWQGGRNQDGYGITTVDGRSVRVHRREWERLHGPIPAGKCVLHSCDNPPCYEGSHLFLGTRADNMADCIAKGRMRRGVLSGGDNPHSKLTSDQVRTIRATAVPGRGSATSIYRLAKEYGVSKRAIQFVLSGRNWQ